jgi:hypothetical protein
LAKSLSSAPATTAARVNRKKKPVAPSADLFDPTHDFLSPDLLMKNSQKADLLSQANRTRLPYSLFLQSNYEAIDHHGLSLLQDPSEYSKISKTTSFGIAYPLTSRITLDGRYVVIKGNNLESASPLVGGTYRLNAATSISVSYPDISPASQNTVSAAQSNANHPAAELKIHF